MIIVQLLGGMGNQMFQYALGRHLSVKNNVPLMLDTSILLDWKPGRHLVNRDFDLDIFNIDPVIASRKDISDYNPQLMNTSEKIFFHLKRKAGFTQGYKETSFAYDDHVLQLQGKQYLAGLWQSYKYFEGIENLIRQDFQIKTEVGKNSEKLLAEITGCEAVCINIRRTDYVSVKQTADVMGFIGLDYFQKAIRVLLEKKNNINFYIFSDDVQWCREHIHIDGQQVNYVDHSHAGKKFDDYFRLMRACKHFIIPNSTFGWWAAWLCTNKDKIVIAPQQWMNDPAVNTQDLIPPSWIRL